ncbi:3-oxo-5-alpha-steroid 4-dehydrogenase-domain-containing protein [Morchella snyderi]|nr:3-oxo-5-alpha-steroid 4-dehydrogenase-domain-containing protein [Morchella snyderi]
MISLQIRPRGRPIKKLPSSIEIDLATCTTESLYTRLSAITGLSRDRLRLTKGSDGSVIAVKKDSGKDVMAEELGLLEDSMIFAKDLGPQIDWRTVFQIEYLGPLIMHPLALLYLRPYLYSNSPLNPLSHIPYFPTADVIPPATTVQNVLCVLTTLHFVKREFETTFVHRFSANTMPFNYVYRNSAHYWILSGILMALFFYTPAPTTAGSWWPSSFRAENNPVVLYGGIALWVFAQLSNLATHMTLRSLRPEGSTKRAIPTGYGFNTVTCPNYSFEILGWLAVWLISGGNWSVGLFIAVGGFTMAKWAMKKERRYRKEFGSAYKKKKVMIPCIL